VKRTRPASSGGPKPSFVRQKVIFAKSQKIKQDHDRTDDDNDGHGQAVGQANDE